MIIAAIIFLLKHLKLNIMKTKKNLCIVVILFFSYINNATCQIYKRGFGLKMGGSKGYVGVTVKEFLNQRMSLENSIIMVRPLKDCRSISLQTLLQLNQEIGNSASLYCSFGPNINFKENRSFNKTFTQPNFSIVSQTKIAFNVFMGVEKELHNSDLFFSVDAGPSINFNSKIEMKFMLNFSLKYTVKHLGFKPHHNLSKISYRKWN
jgi:hypothetical protein